MRAVLGQRLIEGETTNNVAVQEHNLDTIQISVLANIDEELCFFFFCLYLRHSAVSNHHSASVFPHQDSAENL